MRTAPCNCYSGHSRNTSCWEYLKRPLIFSVVLLAIALTVSELFDRFLRTDSAGGSSKGDLRGKINELSQSLDNLARMQSQLDKKLSQLPSCCTDGTANTQEVGKTDIQEAVDQAIATYDADDIGLADFALESAGGAVISTPETESYTEGIQPATLFGIPLCQPRNTPSEMIKPGNLPGECWAFKGKNGAAIIRLLGFVNVSSVSLEHIPIDISPTGETDTAPREFSLWGINCEKEDERFLLGNFVYDNTRKPVQNFPVQFQSSEPFHHVHLKVHSNYGHPNYTCIYRVRIHGNLTKTGFGLR